MLGERLREAKLLQFLKAKWLRKGQLPFWGRGKPPETSEKQML